ncbi:methionyl-tRNA synthetase [Hanseniaspora valbyensis NRRL Y-1626]|uniref:methionine--tRNA ligase n=1 Tax=Hanseniaspora valbyensis NRRL Y-1626 TaxID=766949 RepID=A0A1B7TGU9_9ASCO|nr:methionyl-tRNA synthetase [Hanseniaspora valbyensis NRRL Y-1626]
MSFVITPSSDKFIKNELVLKAFNFKVILASKVLPKSELNLDTSLASPGLINESINFQLFNANAILQYALKEFVVSDEVLKLETSLTSSSNNDAEKQILSLLKFDDSTKKLIKNASNWILLGDYFAFTGKLPESIDCELILSTFEDVKKTIKNKRVITVQKDGTTAFNKENVIIPISGDEKILPKDGERNVLITSALPYVNNVPHLGNIIGSVLSADIYSRYCKNRGYNTLYVCGTDEYGTATETKAIEDGCTPKELCDKYHKIHKQVYDWFQIGFDKFGRTTTEKQTEIAQDIFLKLNENGYLEEQTMKQLYCPEHNGYLADRYVEGECPKCQYEDARGDQCDKCGSLLDPFELVNPRCKLDNATPVPKFSEHIFLRLNELEKEINEWSSSAAEKGQWSKNSRTITNSWLKEGLNPRCITRDLVWGTPVPLEKFKNKVLYVWFDAPIGYCSITANYTDDWEKWWKNPENVQLYQFMGKDNVPFHTVIFPGSQLGTKENWTMLHHLSTTEYLQYENGKFSKSRGVGVFGNNAQDIGVSPSVWRYFLASMRPETSDSQFSWSDFVTRNNSELLANLGNFVNRIMKFVNSKYNSVIPEFSVDDLPNYSSLKSDVDELLATYISEMEKVHLKKGLETAMLISARGNQFLQENKLDNNLFINSPKHTDAVVGIGLNLIYTLASVISPYMPETSDIINNMLNAPALKISKEFNLNLQKNHNINEAQYLFTRIDEKNIEIWRNKFSGQQVK